MGIHYFSNKIEKYRKSLLPKVWENRYDWTWNRGCGISTVWITALLVFLEKIYFTTKHDVQSHLFSLPIFDISQLHSKYGHEPNNEHRTWMISYDIAFILLNLVLVTTSWSWAWQHAFIVIYWCHTNVIICVQKKRGKLKCETLFISYNLRMNKTNFMIIM